MSRFTIQVEVDPSVVAAAKRAVPRGTMAIEDHGKLVRDKVREWARDGMIIAAAGAQPRRPSRGDVHVSTCATNMRGPFPGPCTCQEGL